MIINVCSLQKVSFPPQKKQTYLLSQYKRIQFTFLYYHIISLSLSC